jgi:hypothetical protein
MTWHFLISGIAVPRCPWTDLSQQNLALTRCREPCYDAVLHISKWIPYFVFFVVWNRWVWLFVSLPDSYINCARNKTDIGLSINLLKSTGCCTYHQVQHSKILHANYIACLCFVWLSEETVPFALYIIKIWVFITEAVSVYCAVRFEALYKTDMFRP